MSRRAILLIGTEKTGTTTLQHFLAANRAALRANGFAYPEFCGAANHTGLAAYAMAGEKRDAIRLPFGAAGEADVEPMRARLRAAAAEELPGDETAIFCSEHCHSRLTTAEEVGRLRDFLARFFGDVQIAVYLRRQDQIALSLYSTRLKSGDTERAILPRTHADEPYFNYDRSLGLWEASFGRENVHVRIFDRARLAGGDVVTDFVATWGLAGQHTYAKVANLNESISPLAQEFLRCVNMRLEPIEGLPLDAVRGPLAAGLARLLPGRGARPSRADAEAFYGKFRPSNEEVRRRHFPDRETLFDEDFSDYPETEDRRDFDADDLAAVAAVLQTAATRETRRLEAEIAIRDARLHWQRDEPAAAERALQRALAWAPNHAEIYRALAEERLREGRLDEALAAASAAVERKPGAHEYWHFLGVLRRRTGDLDGAAAAQNEALRLAPHHAAVRRELSQLAARQQDRHPQGAAPRTDEAAACPRPLSA